MKRWHHGHSIGTGAVMGLLLDRHVWAVLVLGIAIGIALAYMRQTASWFAALVADRTRRKSERRPGRSGVAPTPVYRGDWQSKDIPY